MYRAVAFTVLLSLLSSGSVPIVAATPDSHLGIHSLPPPARYSSPAAQDLPADLQAGRNAPLQASQLSGPASPATAYQPILAQSTAVYTFTGSPIVTPTIDGVFTGLFVDGDGTTTPGAGLKNPLAFVVEKQFDADDNVYWYDPGGTFTAWNPAIMTLWLDGNDDGIFQPFTTDAVIAGAIPPAGVTGVELNGLTSFPFGSSPLGFSPFVYNDAEFIYDTPSKANNRYDDGEDIYYVGQYAAYPSSVDSVSEFRGGQQLLLPDPNNPNGPAIAHIYIEQDADYMYFHNDFLADADSTFYDFDNLASNNGFIDGDGVTSSFASTPDRIGIDPAARKWFTPTDSVDWFDADDDSHWSPNLDALWQDNDGDNTYNSGTDSIIVYAGGTLTENLTATVVLNLATFEFVYSDDNLDGNWDSSEDIWALSGDEIWDYNYFDNRIAWLIDGDGAVTAGRGSDNAVRVDGDQWFDAEDRVYWFDANSDEEWTEATDALWQDKNLNGTYQAATDTVIRASTAISENTTARMLLLQRMFVDGDGTATSGDGSDNTSRVGQAPFRPSDLVFWHDGDKSQDWTVSDTLWIDDGDGIFGDSITDTIIVSAAGFVSGTVGALLTPAAHWIGYDDGEVAYNGRYDSGEDISASNSYFAYDDLEVDPNFKYDLGEDIYDRDYLEIWVYAEGDNRDARMGGNAFAPDREPALRDIGFRVHLNGIRIDAVPPITNTRTITDYDAPHGIQAAAGWGPSRGFVGATFSDPAFGSFTRHYEYRIPRQNKALGGVSVRLSPAAVLKESEHAEIIAILPDCSVLIHITWKDVWQRNKQGKFVSGTGNEYPTSSGEDWVWETWDWLHPPPLPPAPLPPVKNDLNDPYLPNQTVMPGMHGPKPLADSFFDVYFMNTFETEILQMNLTSSSPLGEKTDVLGWQASSPETTVQMGAAGQLATVYNLPPGGWVELTGATQVTNISSPGSRVTNTVQVTGTTPVGPMPPVAPGSDSLTYDPPITITLVKTTPISTVLPGGRVTYTILYENQSQFQLRNVQITDTLPVSLTPQSGYPVDSFFDITYRIDLPAPLPRGGRGHIQIVGVVSPTVKSGSRITNTVRASFETPLTGATFRVATLPLMVSYRIFLSVILKN